MTMVIHTQTSILEVIPSAFQPCIRSPREKSWGSVQITASNRRSLKLFFFHLSSRSVALRHQRRFISNPAPNLGSLLRKAADGRPRPLSCTIRRLRPDLGTIRSTGRSHVVRAVQLRRARTARRVLRSSLDLTRGSQSVCRINIRGRLSRH